MRRLLICTSLLLLLSASFVGQASNWRTYTDKTGNFSVLFPSEPKDELNGDQNEQVSHIVQALDGGAGYTVVYVVNKSEQKVDEPTFSVFRDAVVKGLPNCTIVTEQAAAPAITGYYGHWLRLKCQVEKNEIASVGNIYWGKRYAYAVMAMYRTDHAEPPEQQRFLNSFSPLDAK